MSIAGPAGSGKSLALESAADLARSQGARVVSVAVRSQATTGPWSESGAALGLEPFPTGADPFTTAHWLMSASEGLSPVLLCLDDVHLLAESDRQVLDVLATEATASPVWIAATIENSRGSDSTEWLARLSTTLTLRPLEDGEAANLVRRFAATASDDFIAGAVELGGGSPLVLRELCEADERHEIESVSLSSRACTAAFGTSAEPDLAVLAALALVEGPQTPDDLATSSGLNHTAVRAALATGTAHGCLVGGDAVEWRSSGSARLCLQAIDPAVRRSLQATRAEVDLALGRHLQAARHLHSALPLSDPRRTVEVYRTAARIGPGSELEALRSAIAIVRSTSVGSELAVDITRMLGRAESAAGGAVIAADLLFEAADLARGGEADTYCRVVLDLLDTILTTGSLDLQQKSVPHLVAATARADDSSPMTRAHMRAITARLATVRGDRNASDLAISQTFDLLPDGGDPSDTVGLALSLHRACNGVGRRSDAARCVELARFAADSCEDPELQLRVETAAGYDALDAGDRGALLRSLDAMSALRRGVERPSRRLESLVVENAVAIMEARHAAAERGLGELVSVARQAGVSAPAVSRQFAMLGMETTDFAGFLPALLAESDNFPQSATLRSVAALALLRSGDAAQARSIVDGFALAGYDDIGAGGPAPVSAAVLAQIIYELGATELASGLLTQIEPYGSRCVVDVTGSAMWLGSLDHHRGLLLFTLGSLDAAVASLRSALGVHEDMRALCWAARSRQALAVALEARDASGDEEEAAELRELAGKVSAEFGLFVAVDPPVAQNATLVFRRSGEGWEFGRDGHRLSDRVGYRHLHRLMSSPGELVPAEDLAPDRDGPAGRARVSVTRALRSALKELARVDASLGAWLDASVKTGSSCVYEPPVGEPREWRLK